jgi:hypothetical protein
MQERIMSAELRELVQASVKSVFYQFYVGTLVGVVDGHTEAPLLRGGRISKSGPGWHLHNLTTAATKHKADWQTTK